MLRLYGDAPRCTAWFLAEALCPWIAAKRPLLPRRDDQAGCADKHPGADDRQREQEHLSIFTIRYASLNSKGKLQFKDLLSALVAPHEVAELQRGQVEQRERALATEIRD